MSARRVFVYGSLMRGGQYHELLAGAAFVGEARTEPGYRLYHLGTYPAMRREGHASVAGELYDVDRGILAKLDRLEGHPDYYRRATIRLDDGREVTSYLLADERPLASAPVVTSGDWRRR